MSKISDSQTRLTVITVEHTPYINLFSSSIKSHNHLYHIKVDTCSPRNLIMSSGSILLLFLAAIASTMVVGQARTIAVGGTENWSPNHNYTDWSLKNSPFNINDTLVFKYESPHNVYLLPNLWSYINCDFKNAKLLADETNGVDDGFAVVLNQWRLYYFASSNGDDCSSGMMKFFAMPLPRWNNN